MKDWWYKVKLRVLRRISLWCATYERRRVKEFTEILEVALAYRAGMPEIPRNRRVLQKELEEIRASLRKHKDMLADFEEYVESCEDELEAMAKGSE